MYNVFKKFLNLELRLCITMVISIIVIIFDSKLNIFLPFRNYVGNSVHLFYCLYSQSISIFDSMSKIFMGYKELIEANNELQKELFLKNGEMLLVDQYRQENRKLCALLNAPIQKSHRILLAKVLFMKIDSCHQQAIINQGMRSDVYIDQPVITDIGVVGQVIEVNENNSRILLISDYTHALSVKLKRNDARMILQGRGYNTELYAEYPGNMDVYIDDILVTSGLDGRFPEGYPVAIVSGIQINSERDFTIIRARP